MRNDFSCKPGEVHTPQNGKIFHQSVHQNRPNKEWSEFSFIVYDTNIRISTGMYEYVYMYV